MSFVTCSWLSLLAFLPSQFISWQVLQHAPQEEQRIITTLWEALLELDEVSSSTQSVLKLLSAFLHHLTHARPAAIEHCHSSGTPLHELVNRLWPFVRHSSTTIRGAALEALTKIVRAVADAGAQPALYGAVDAGLCHIFQGLLVEEATELLPQLRALWLDFLMLPPTAALADLVRQRRLLSWFTLLVTPAGKPMDPVHLLTIVPPHRRSNRSGSKHGGGPPADMYVVGGPAQIININPSLVLASRLEGADAMGLLGARWQMDGVAAKEMYTLLSQMMAPNSATKRLLSGAIMTAWATAARGQLASPTATSPALHPRLCQTALETLNKMEGFAELTDLVGKMRQEATSLVMAFANSGLDYERVEALGDLATFTLDQASTLLDETVPHWEAILNTRSGLDNRRVTMLALRATVDFMNEELQRLRLASNGALACAITQANALPEKIKPVLQYLVESLKHEDQLKLQQRCAAGLAYLMRLMSQRQPCPNAKIVALLYGVLGKDSRSCPTLGVAPATLTEGIYTLYLMDLEEAAVEAARRKRNGKKGHGRGGRGETSELTADELEEEEAVRDLASNVEDEVMAAGDDGEGAGSGADADEKVDVAVVARGANFGLQALAAEFGNDLFTTLPTLLGNIGEPVSLDAQPGQPLAVLSMLLPASSTEPILLEASQAQSIIGALAQLEILATATPATLRHRLLDAVPYVMTAICAMEPVVRYKASLCLASLAAQPECREPVSGSRFGEERTDRWGERVRGGG